MDLFTHKRQQQIEQEAPLAHRMRPRTLEQYAGQAHIIGPGRLLRRAIQADQLSSLIFYGPPGTGKTTLAMVIANTTQSHFITINAVLAGVKEIRAAIAEAQERRALHSQRTTLFVDEVHRWNKAQQDALLPHVENGTIILIGATTENPYFEVNKALVSRSRIFQLKPLTEADLRQIAQQALTDPERGYGRLPITLDDNALNHLVDVANGDARGVLNALELAVETTDPDENGRIHISLQVAEESIQRRAVLYDKEGDVHYDTISAFIKSLRGSDPDAALYWMAKMVYAGEDPRFIFRRMAIFAGEDVGLADPHALSVVTSCWEAFERIGMPEGRFPLAQACLYLATAPKSNSAFAFFDALETVAQEREADVPNHLKDGNRDKKGFGHGQGYLYPHAYRDHWVAQQYLPDSLQGKLFYQPSDQGYERQIRAEVARKREAQLAAMVEGESAAPPEILTNSPPDRARARWLQRTISQAGQNVAQVRDRLFDLAQVQRHHLVLNIGAGSGLLTWEAVRQAPEGGVWALATKPTDGAALQQQVEQLPELERPFILIGSLSDLPTLLGQSHAADLRFDQIMARNPLTTHHIPLAELAACGEWLAENGRLSIAQTIPQQGQRLYELVEWTDDSLRQAVAAAEEAIYQDTSDPLVNWNEADITAVFREAGWSSVTAYPETQTEQRHISPAMIDRWFGDIGGEETAVVSPRPTYRQRLAQAGLTDRQIEQVATRYRQQLADQTVVWQTNIVYLVAS